MPIDPLLERGARAIFERHGCKVTVEGLQIAGEVPGLGGIALTISHMPPSGAARYESPQNSVAVAAVHGLDVTAELDAFVEDYKSGRLKARVSNPLGAAKLPQPSLPKTGPHGTK